MNIKNLTTKIMDGYSITMDEAMELWNEDFDLLLESSRKIKKHFCSDTFDVCTIVNAKSGRCSEDCSYCAQSIYYKTEISEFPLLSIEEILEDAKLNYSKGIRRYSIVTSGKRASEEEVDMLCKVYKSISESLDMKLCSSNGLLTSNEFVRFKKAGVSRVHNNLETSRSYFKNICTSHTYDEKIQTINDALDAGLEVCSGGIIGLGESKKDRLDLAFELKKLGIKSIPLNLLNPIAATPLEHSAIVSEEEFLRSAAIFRFINPSSVIRLAGGRSLLSSYGKKAFESSINGTISGELLTTYGSDTIKDLKMIRELGYEIND